MIDIWMIFCMLNPFFEVLLHALSQALVREWDNDLEQRFSDETMTKLETLLMLLWKLLGCLALAFVFFYWTIALLPSSSEDNITSNTNVACIEAV